MAVDQLALSNFQKFWNFRIIKNLKFEWTNVHAFSFFPKTIYHWDQVTIYDQFTWTESLVFFVGIIYSNWTSFNWKKNVNA